MSLFEPVDDDKLAENLLAPKPKVPKKKVFHQIPDEPRIIETERATYYECENCGWCEYPGFCVWSFDCPNEDCPGKVGEHCKHPSGRISTLHRERWKVSDDAIAEMLKGGVNESPQ